MFIVARLPRGETLSNESLDRRVPDGTVLDA
jgi:hypothetical protein